MKIAFDVSDLTTNRADGTTRYTNELARHLPALMTPDTWDFHAPHASTAINTAALGHTNVRRRYSPWPKYWTQLRFPLALYQHPPDVLFMPIQQLPFLHPACRTVAVIHDLAFHYFPAQYTYKDWALLHLFTAHAAREADQIIAVSKSTAADIANTYGRTDAIVIHHGVDHERFHVPSQQEREGTWQTLRQKYPRLVQPYLLFVGQMQPRKNLIRLVEAFEVLQQKNKDLQLVIASGHGWLQQPILERIKKSSAAQHILFTGRVPDELLPSFYWHAQAFVMPSLYEGFGMPILEAQACGCPVVTSNTSSMPEVGGAGAIFIEPEKTASLIEGIKAAIHDSALIKVGTANAAKYSWHNTAVQTAKVLGQFAGSM